MTTTTTVLVPSCLDVTRLAVGSFLARYREPTLTAYTEDLKAFLGWCQTYDREALRVTRGELELYVRHLESRGYAAATGARRFGTVATFYRYAVIDGVIPANPAAAVSRPKVSWEGQKRTVLHPLEFAALLAAGRSSGPNDHALVCLLGMLGLLGLRVSDPGIAGARTTYPHRGPAAQESFNLHSSGSSWSAGCDAKSHVRCGGRAGETEWEQSQHRAPVRPLHHG